MIILGHIYFIYMYIRNWNHERLRNRRQKKMLDSFVLQTQKNNSDICQLEKRFENKHAIFMQQVHEFASWQSDRFGIFQNNLLQFANSSMTEFDSVEHKLNVLNKDFSCESLLFQKNFYQHITESVDKNLLIKNSLIQKSFHSSLDHFCGMVESYNIHHMSQLNLLQSQLDEYDSFENKNKEKLKYICYKLEKNSLIGRNLNCNSTTDSNNSNVLIRSSAF